MKRWKKVVLIASGILIAGVGVYGVFLYHAVKSTMNAIYEPLDPAAAAAATASTTASVPQAAPVSSTTLANVKQARGEQADLSRKDPFTLLVLGVDQREHDTGRSDSIVVLTVNPEKHSVLMLNIPRDTRTEIIGHGTVDKINHAYAFGGVDMAVDTIQTFLDVPIDYYVKVNMEGFEQIIDLLGGVTVDNPFAFSIDGIDYPAGTITLNGHKALMYSRMRYDDPKGDIGRNGRQQSILAELIDHSKQLSNLTKVTDILKQIEGSTKTNLTLSDMNTLFMKYRNDIDSIEQDEVQGTGEMINHIYYYKVSEAEKNRIRAEILKQLE